MSKKDSDLRSLLREALEFQRDQASSPEVASVEVDPWCKAGIVRLTAQPSGTDLGFYQEFVKPNCRRLERIEVISSVVNYSVENILDPWHEPETSNLMTAEEFRAIRRLAPEPWTPHWKHRVNPPKAIDVDALLRELS